MLTQQVVVLMILAATIILLIFDILRVDVVAILCMLALGWSGILEPLEMISGFSSNAVVAMLAVMVIGYGISKTGIMEEFSRWIIKMVSGSKRKLIVLVSISVGLVSALIQNIGAAALFLPVIIIISKKGNYHPSELIMPMGFAAILGGTLTMIASGPLIILNDFLRNANLEPYNLFSVTPVGLLLLLAGILYFFFLGPYVLPKRDVKVIKPEQEMLIDSWQLPSKISHYLISADSKLVNNTPEAAGIWEKYQLNILALSMEKDIEYAPWRETHFKPGQKLALLGNEDKVKEFTDFYNLKLIEKSNIFPDFQNPEKAGFAESIIPPRSDFIGKTIRQLAIRKNYHVEPVLIFSQGKAVRGNFSDRPLVAGDILIFHGLWRNINQLKETGQIIVLTSIKTESEKKEKSLLAITCFAAGIGLALAGYPLSIAFLTGAVVMVLTGVLSIEEFYQAIDWKVVFLIAGLIPLGIAMEKTGTAAFLAEKAMLIMQEKHPVIIIFSIALLSTLFSLFMSNVASTVVLVPLIINLSTLIKMDARPLVLLVAVCAANSFILPTHQVNAMLITAGSYENSDYLKAGGIMTLLFLVVVTFIFYLFYF